VQRLDGVHTDKDLCDFMAKTSEIREPLDNVQYRYWLIPDFSKDRSVMITKAHHSLGDGMSLTTMGMLMSDTYDAKNLSGLKPLPLSTKIIQ